MPPAGWLSKLARLDAYPKINEDFFTRTASGGLVTLVAMRKQVIKVRARAPGRRP